jgi:hypothetical protein
MECVFKRVGMFEKGKRHKDKQKGKRRRKKRKGKRKRRVKE